MKLELKPFQTVTARDIMSKLDKVRDSVAGSDLEAIVLAAPTGSGKTITLAQVMDYTYGGGDGIPARPHTVFLWLSDSPELNAQSTNKLIGACDHLPFHKVITIGSDSFSDDELQPGYVYFINTQLLGKDKLLTKEGGGDFRTTTFWQAVAKTIARDPQNLSFSSLTRRIAAQQRPIATAPPSCRNSSSVRRPISHFASCANRPGHERNAAEICRPTRHN